MKIRIAENIRSMRKQHGMMQEQLAEALGVSIAAVSKWERGIAVPDLSYIVGMADLFGVSTDTLVGYQVLCGGINELEERIHSLQKNKNFEEASTEAEKALMRYPNDFRIVYRCGEMYQMKGMETGEASSLERAIELFRRAIPLLYQNTNPVISETMIQMEIAQCLLELGKETEGLELLKKYNVYGVNDSLIGYTYASSDNQAVEEAVPYLIRAYADCMQVLIRTMCGYANMYTRKNDYDAALEAMQWLVQYLESLKTDPAEVSYVDKLLARFYAECGYLSGKDGLTERAKEYLREAYSIAGRFDAEPTYGVRGLKFCIGDTKNATAFDSMGSTAIMAIENGFCNGSSTPEIIKYWEDIKNGSV